MKSSWCLAGVSALLVAGASCSAARDNHAAGVTGGTTESGSGGGSAAGGGTASNGSGAGKSASTSTSNGTGTGGQVSFIGSTSGAGGGATCPAFKSCAQQGFTCGSAPDGCGTLQDCGTCRSPETCGGGGTPYQCGSPACTKQTCASLNYNCGMASDGCNGTLDCGSCTAGETCGASSPNVCGTGVCTPKNCADQNFNCGSQGDGCGNTIDCGTCPASQVCGGGVNPQTGVCGTPACASQSCAQQGFNCGMATDGCGNVINCGTCTGGQVCGATMSNVCGGGGGCPAGSNLVYVLDTDNVIHSFNPPAKTFATVATLDCDAQQPNSMAIDRNLIAWVNYLEPGTTYPNDYIYKFDLTKGSGCVGSGITIPNGYTQVGMGFSSDTAGGTTETLYVDGIGGAGLASVDMTTNTIVPIGNFPNDNNIKGQSCELTGTGSALLYGYFTTSPYVRVAQINKTNSDEISDTQLTGFTPPDDWAFSFFGGNFYMYAYPNSSNSPTSDVIEYIPASPATATSTPNLTYMTNVGFTIIGAGVSTCAQTTPCTPKTCAEANVQCGPAGDGCGNIIQCPVCSTGQVCVGGACTTGCTPKTCAEQGFSCGMQGDGCGDALNCGTCPSGTSTCNGGVCTSGTCTPKTCADLNDVCGSAGDGCGNIINCGTCPSGEVCSGGQCSTPVCTPKNCAELGYNCGQATNGCGGIINCGSCSGSQTCGGGGTPNVCGGQS